MVLTEDRQCHSRGSSDLRRLHLHDATQNSGPVGQPPSCPRVSPESPLALPAKSVLHGPCPAILAPCSEFCPSCSGQLRPVTLASRLFCPPAISPDPASTIAAPSQVFAASSPALSVATSKSDTFPPTHHALNRRWANCHWTRSTATGSGSGSGSTAPPETESRTLDASEEHAVLSVNAPDFRPLQPLQRCDSPFAHLNGSLLNPFSSDSSIVRRVRPSHICTCSLHASCPTTEQCTSSGCRHRRLLLLLRS